MNDVKNTLKPLEWTMTTANVDKNSFLPVLVKPTKETASRYQILEDPVLLRQFWTVQRLVAQCLEDEGAYVVGPQVDIPSEFSGTFKYLPEQKGNQSVVQTFPSMKEVASEMPQRVFCQDSIVVYPLVNTDLPSNDDKVKSVVLQQREQLSIIEKKDVYTALPASRFPFVGKNKMKYVTVPCIAVIVESSKEVLNMPLNTRGPFSTLLNLPIKDREYTFGNILLELDLPINLTTTRNCPKTLLDESFLQPGTRFRISAIEEHEVILGVTAQGKIIEFAADGEEFLLPSHLDKSISSKEQEIAYQTALQRFLLELQIKDSPVNIKDYQKSIRRHVSRNVRCTSPKPLHMVAALRESQFSTKPSPTNELTAIAFFSSANGLALARRSSFPSSTGRSQIPLPTVPDDRRQQYTPPLPPRNKNSMKTPGIFSPPPDIPSRPPPLPPSYAPEDLPSRPPPLPPAGGISRSRPKSFTVGQRTNQISHGHSWGSGSYTGLLNGHGMPDRTSPAENAYGESSTRVPSPPHEEAPTVIESRNTSLYSNTPEASTSQPDKEKNDDMWGIVGGFQENNRRSSRRKNRSSPYENVMPQNQESSPFSEVKNDQTGSSSAMDNDSSAPSQTVVARARPLSPEFERTASYDNPAYEQSPTESDDHMSEESERPSPNPVYCNVNLVESSDKMQLVPNITDEAAPSVVQPTVQITVEGHDTDENNSKVQSPEDGPISPGHQTSEDEENSASLPHSTNELSDDIVVEIVSDDVGNAAIDLTELEVNQESETAAKTVYHSTDDDVTVAFDSPASDDRDNHTKENWQHLEQSDDGKIKDENLKNSDSNNNDIIEQFLSDHASRLTSPRPLFSDETPDLSMTTMSGEHSISSHSLASTKSSVVGFDMSIPLTPIFPGDVKARDGNREFWITQYSVSNTDNAVHQHASFTCNYAHPPDDWMPPEDLSSLSVADVSNSLRFIGMNEDTVEWFYAEKVDGQLLCTLEDQDFSEHFHLTPFQCKKLVMFLKGWRPKLK